MVCSKHSGQHFFFFYFLDVVALDLQLEFSSGLPGTAEGSGSVSGVQGRCPGPRWGPPRELLGYWIGYKMASKERDSIRGRQYDYKKEPKEKYSEMLLFNLSSTTYWHCYLSVLLNLLNFVFPP